jgi:hypothetical protein
MQAQMQLMEKRYACQKITFKTWFQKCWLLKKLLYIIVNFIFWDADIQWI